ncbi:2-hydroxyacyl-CoA dehydratase subunit D [Thermodesulfobacteriota bacterium]
MTPFEEMQRHYQHRDLAPKEWKEKGGKVVGYFCDNVPEEFILAAGFFPLRLSGDPRGSTEAARKQRVPFMWADREDFVHSMLNMILTGEYDFLDYLVIPHARASIHSLRRTLFGLKESDPALKLPELYYLKNLHTTFYSSGLFNRDQWIEFKETLEEWSGKEITNESLSQAIDIGNENKMLLKRIAELRPAEPPRISGVEALQIIGSSMFMLKEKHNKLLKAYLDEAEGLPSRDGARLFVEGSPLDNLQLYELIESKNATVVAENNCWGNRYSDVPVDTSFDPLEAIIDRYNDKSPCSRMFPIERRIEYCLRSAEEAKAQGVIFNIFKDDECEAWETPEKIKAFKARGIPALHLRQQPYLISEPEQILTGIEELLKSI